MTGGLTAEEQSRTDAVGRLTTELHTLVDALQQTADQLREQNDRTHQDVRDQLHRQSASLAGDFSHKHAELSAALEEAVRQLTTQKTDRASLAALFQKLSKRLSHDQPPQHS